MSARTAAPEHPDADTEDADRHSEVESLQSPSEGPSQEGADQDTNERNAGQSNRGRGRPRDGRKTQDAELLECGCRAKGRALIICFDGTSNQFGENNTNVIELYDRIVKNKQQLTYYNSGIGTYAKPSWRSFGYWKQVVFNTIDLAIAWDFEKIILGGYRWLSAHYEDGDKIYLFGFSRGAYQVRALAAMIHKVGLILPGNEEQIPFAYELYADHRSDKYRKRGSKDTFDMAARFKQTFSRENVRVHYLGIWDTVSSVGVVRTKSLPSTDRCEHFCYMRHALALDERRVKFLPEYACGGESQVPEQPLDPDFIGPLAHGPEGQARARDKSKSRPHVKEVWFVGSHSDIGGGVKSNTELNNAAIPALWMGNEAMSAGLDLKPSRAVWNWNTVKKDRPTESLGVVWRILEVFPFKHLSYKDKTRTRWRPHVAKPRIIKPGQKIHASVAFVENYRPKAKFSKDAPGNWDNIIGEGNIKSPEWAHALGDLLELDLFDHSDIPNIMTQLSKRQSHTRAELLDRLAFMAGDEGGARAITSDPKFETLFNILDDENSDTDVKIAASDVLIALARQDYIFDHDVATRAIFRLIVEPNKKLQSAGLKALSGFRLYRIPREVSVTIRDLVMNGTGEDRLSATMALCSCIHQPEFLHGITQHMDISDLIDILVGYLEGDDIGAKLSCVRGLVNLTYRESARKAIARKPRVAIALVSMLDDDDPVVCKAGLQGVLAFGHSDTLRALIRATPAIKFLSKVLESNRLAMQHSALWVLSGLVQNDGIANDLTNSDILKQLRRLLESEPRLHITCLRFLQELSKHRPAHTTIIKENLVHQLMIIMKSGDLVARCQVKGTFAQMLAHDQLRRNAMDLGLVQALADILTEPERYSLEPWSATTLATNDSLPVQAAKGAYENASQGQYSVDGGTFGNISGGHFYVRDGNFGDVSGGIFTVLNGAFGDVSGGTFVVLQGNFGDVSGGTFIVFHGNFGNVTGGNFIVYGGNFGDVRGGKFVVSEGNFGEVHGGQFLVSGGNFGQVTIGEFNSPNITLNKMSGSLGIKLSLVNQLSAIYTHFNGVKELVERLAEFEESRAQLIQTGIISTLVDLVGIVGVAAFQNILKYDDIRAAALKANVAHGIVTSILDKGLVNSDDCNKDKIEVLSEFTRYDSTSRKLIKHAITQQLPTIRNNAGPEVTRGLKQLLSDCWETASDPGTQAEREKRALDET